MLPPGLYLVLSLSAVAGVAGLAWLLGFRAARRLQSLQDAREAILIAEPGAQLLDLHVSANGANAVGLDADKLYIVACVADGLTVRSYPRQGVDVTFYERSPKVGIRIDPGDVGVPPILALANNLDAGRLLARRFGARPT